MTAPRVTPGPDSPRPSRAWTAGAFALVLVVCAGVYWPGIGATGFSMSEGHRVLPAWEMLDRGEYLVPRLFGQAYLRKPPGMPWAVAISSALLGRIEFAARAVSAASMTIMAAVAFVFAARWYGRRWAVVGGLATALAPLIWNSGRSAEIEALNNVATHAAVLLLLDLLLFRPTGSAAGRVARSLALTIALTAVGLAKGYASLPCLIAAVTAACLLLRSGRPALSLPIWGATTGAGAVLGWVTWRIALAAQGEPLVIQGRSDFLWNSEHLTLRGMLGVIKLAPESLLLTFPAAAAMFFPWGPDARAEAGRSDEARCAFVMARGVSLTCLLSLAFYTLLGVDNPRYALPACVTVPMAVPYVFRGMAEEFSPLRRLIARLMLFGSRWVALAMSLAGAIFFQYWHDRERRVLSGREAGVALAAAIPDGAQVWADGLIEARPDVPHYARAEAARHGRAVTIRWMPHGPAGMPIPPAGGLLLLRSDAGLDEVSRFALEHPGVRTEPLARGAVYKFEFVLLRVAD